jgi:hypothetical protein
MAIMQCGCEIVLRNAQYAIAYCSRHAAADDMYERLGECCYGLEAVTSYHNNDAWDEEIRKAKAVLAKADKGKRTEEEAVQDLVDWYAQGGIDISALAKGEEE